MNECDSEVAHPGNGINTSKTTALRPIWQFAIDTSIRIARCDARLLRPDLDAGGHELGLLFERANAGSAPADNHIVEGTWLVLDRDLRLWCR
jgi:hypothetical protein